MICLLGWMRLHRILKEIRPWVGTKVLKMRHTHLLKHRIQPAEEMRKDQVQNRKIRLAYKEREWLVGYLSSKPDLKYPRGRDVVRH